MSPFSHLAQAVPTSDRVGPGLHAAVRLAADLLDAPVAVMWLADAEALQLPADYRVGGTAAGLEVLAECELVAEGRSAGWLRVLDVGERTATAAQQRVLGVLGDQIAQQVDLRRRLVLQEEDRLSLEADAWGRVNAVAALRDSEERYRSLFENLDSGFCIIQMVFDTAMNPVDYIFVEVNPAFKLQTGLMDAAGQSMRALAPGHEQHWFNTYGRVALTGEPIRFENEAQSLDGRFYDVHAFRIGAPGGHRVALLFNDITARRQTERAMVELNETLDRRVAAAVAERERAQEALRQSQKIEAIGQLTGGVAHDFNNLLTVIRGSVELLGRPGLSEERRLRHIAAIGETADRAAKLTSQLLAFSRRQALTPETFELGRSLGDVVGMVDTLMGAMVALDTQVPAEPCFVHADKSQFETAIVNMAINARDAMEGQGRVVITLRPVERMPSVRGHPPLEGIFVAVALADTGQGIAAENLERIFEPFYTTKAAGVGTGLGLSQVIGFAKQSGGEIDVESVPGQGTTFTLYLPRAAADEVMVKADAARALVSGDGARVLVVEDNEDVGAFATQALEELGYAPTLARDATAALAALEAMPGCVDVLFSDVVMPGMSGLELGRLVRERQPELPVVLTSGYSHVLSQDVGHGFEILHKPYTMDQLSDALGRALAGRMPAGRGRAG